MSLPSGTDDSLSPQCRLGDDLTALDDPRNGRSCTPQRRFRRRSDVPAGCTVLALRCVRQAHGRREPGEVSRAGSR